MSYKKKEKDLPDFEDVSSEMNKPIEERIGYPDGNFISAKECMELVELRKKVLIKDAQIAGLKKALEEIHSHIEDADWRREHARQALKELEK